MAFLRRTTLIAALVLASLPAVADAQTRWTVRGAGWGHGIGMSQWGAYGQAREGRDYRQILATYYSGTTLGQAGTRTVRVLLAGNQRRVRLAGARSACGRRLVPSLRYVATRRGSRVVLRSASGRALRSCASPMSASGSAISVGTLGRYRGRVEVRVPRSGSGLHAINAVGLENYVRGVIANESPSGWPAEALKAQAIAARTYALTTSKQGDGFDQYPDVRSQVYRGIRSETSTTNAATAATRGEIVTHGGRAATTFFFSTSGGRTENIEYSFIGAEPRPWLKGVNDPWDRFSPHYRWGPIRYTSGTLAGRLGVGGSLREVEITQRGTSPRIVRARIVGTRSSRTLTGPQIRSRLGLRDTWAYFRRVTTTSDNPDPDEPGAESESGTGDGSGGVTASAERGAVLRGSVGDPGAGRVRLERRLDGRWRFWRHVSLNESGRYVTRVGDGTWRIRDGWAIGPAVRVR